MSHDIHHPPYRVFADGCGECVERASTGLWGLTRLDPNNLRALGRLATETRAGDRKPDDASWADMKGAETLRLAIRLAREAVGPTLLGRIDE